MIELILFTGIYHLKLLLTARLRSLVGDIETSRTEAEQLIKEADMLVRKEHENRERVHWELVERQLRMLGDQLEVIHRIVDPQYNALIRKVEERLKDKDENP